MTIRLAAIRRWTFIAIAITAISACSGTPQVQTDDDPVVSPAVSHEESSPASDPKRIILFIGDGMAVPAVAASSYASGSPLEMLNMDEFGLMTTHEYEFVTTDSAASATAMATGEKTHFNAVSVTPGTGVDEETDKAHQLRTMSEAAQSAGWKTGLVATTRINHATPAPFAAHRHHRQRYEELALDISTSGVDVLLGAGSDFFVDRDDERDLFDEMQAEGYEIATDPDEVRESAGRASRLVGLMHPRDTPWLDTGERAMELDEMVDHSLRVLDRDDPEGFFLMVEGSLIDWGGHALDGDRVVSETLDMDRAVARALEYARGRDDTLVVVTSDHETGAMDLIDGPTAHHYLELLGGESEAKDLTIPEKADDEKRGELPAPFAHFEFGDAREFGPAEGSDHRLTTTFGYFSPASRAHWDLEGRFSAIHTPTVVPIFAEGPGATRAAAVRDNADLGRRLMAWIDGTDPDIRGVDVESAGSEEKEEPDNVIIVIGSGLGMASLTASYYHFGMPAVFEMSGAAVVATHGADSLVNDAAATGTALATGERTRRGVLGKAPVEVGGELKPVASAVDRALESGKKVGLVTTSSIVDPMPAAFFATQQDPGDKSEVIRSLLDLQQGVERSYGLDFIAAGGEHYIDEEYRAEFREQGYSLVERFDEIPGEGPAFYLSGDRAMEGAGRRAESAGLPETREMIATAVEHLNDDDAGFLLIVEAGGIDAAKRDLDRGERLLAELRDFDRAVDEARQFADRDGKTLLIATSNRDHGVSVFDNHYGFYRGRCAALTDCGGDFPVEWFDVATDRIRHGEGLEDRELQGDDGPPRIGMQYTWMIEEAARSRDISGAPTANFVPLFAHGPGATDFGGFMDQPAVGRWLVEWAAPAPAHSSGGSAPSGSGGGSSSASGEVDDKGQDE